MVLPIVLLTVALQSRPTADRQTLLGADEVLRRVAAHSTAPKNADPFKPLRLESAALEKNLIRLSPQQASEAWMGLFRKWEAVVGSSTPNSPNTWEAIMMPPLPAPETWPLIRAQVAKMLPNPKRQATLALFDDLLGRDTAVLKYLESKRHPDADPLKEDVFSPEHTISDAELPIALRAGDLKLLEKIWVRKTLGQTYMQWDGLPDLVKLFGRVRAEAILQKLLEESNHSIGNFNGLETQALARTLELSNISKLKSAQWGQVRGMIDFPLVEAMFARFGEVVLKNNQTGGADFIYALGLADKGEVDHAIQILEQVNSWNGGPTTLVGPGWDESKLFEVISVLLNRKPIEPLWQLYEDLGRNLGQLDVVVKRLGQLLSLSDLTPEQRRTYLARKADLDLALGQTKSAIAEYEECIQLKSNDVADKLLKVADAVQDREALDFVAKSAKSMGTEGGRLPLFDVYLDQDRISEAQRAVLLAAQDVHNVNLSAQGQGRLLNAFPEAGVKLAELYYRENQPTEILTLLREYPSWGAKDLRGVIDSRGSFYSGRRQPSQTLGFYAAWAFSKTGKTPLAIQILHEILSSHPANDTSYKLLNELEGLEAIRFYEKQIVSNPSEPRPLIWKAELLRQMGKLAEAERCVRAAIAMDPNAETSSRGHRQLAFDVLSRIVDLRGNNEDSKPYRAVFEAARYTEQGDQDQEVGLHSAAIEQYRLALTINPKDCVAQLQLIYSLEQIGRKKEAEVARQKLIELIPVSQGTRNGIDIFDWHNPPKESERSAIEKLERTHPRNSGILLIVGQFYEQIGDLRSAVSNFEAAVKISPNIVRGWQAIANLASKGGATRAQLREAVLKLIELEGHGWYGYYSAKAPYAFSDKTSLWYAYQKSASAISPKPASPLFPLEAAKHSLGTGTRPVGNQSIPRSNSPGASLGDLAELRALYP